MDFLDDTPAEILKDIVAGEETLGNLISQVEQLNEALQNQTEAFTQQNKSLLKAIATEETMKKINDEIEYLRVELTRSIDELASRIPPYSNLQDDIADGITTLYSASSATATILIWIEITLVVVVAIGCGLLWRIW